ncbi:hypothetical protein TIFTF001_045160 [Ficus carica]|uniref:Uncharacterized protein n=1 Tax=Ficus carica TaxID=3494 RepID=A0AA87YUX9_FICCA|nr:hypothetical protein TIFTF001_045160 [Ficus carica]
MYQVYIEESEMVVEKAQHSPIEDSAAAAPPPKPGPVSPSRRRRHVTAETFAATRCPPRLFSSLRRETNGQIFSYSSNFVFRALPFPSFLCFFFFFFFFFFLVPSPQKSLPKSDPQIFFFFFFLLFPSDHHKFHRHLELASSLHSFLYFFFFFLVPYPQKSLPKSAASTTGASAILNDAVEDPKTARQAPTTPSFPLLPLRPPQAPPPLNLPLAPAPAPPSVSTPSQPSFQPTLEAWDVGVAFDDVVGFVIAANHVAAIVFTSGIL